MPRRRLRLMQLAAVLAASGLAYSVGRRVPEALASAEAFRVTRFELEGARFLTLDQAVAAAGVEPGASVWDDRTPWEEGLRAHPLVRRVRVRRRLPSTLVIVVEEEEPVALVPTPLLEPVDREGRYLPINPARFTLDLPILRPRPDPADRGGRPSEVRIRPLARAVERMRSDPVFFGQISEVRQEMDGSLRVRWGAGPEVAFLLGGEVDDRKVRQGLEVLSHVLTREPGRIPRTLDLRFADQVVVRF